jgi:hypothetical protein
VSFRFSVDSISESEWNAALSRFPDGGIYQTYAYGAVSWGEKQLSHLVAWRGNELAALAQLRIVHLPLVGRGVAYLRWGPVMAGTSGAWDPEIGRSFVRALVEEYVHRRRLLLRIIPAYFQPDASAAGLASNLLEHGFGLDEEVAPYRTFRVDLTSPIDQIRKRLDQKWRNQLNGAERNDLEVTEGTGSELFAEFRRLYDEMMARKNFETTVSLPEFEQIQQRLPESQKLIVMISRKDGRPMTGLVSSGVGDTGVYLLGATSNDGMKSKGSYLLQWKMMLRLKERGCRWYDLGGINPDTNPGVYHFKQGMGGEEVRGLGRFSLCRDLLSNASVAAAEKAKAMALAWKRRLRQRPALEPAPKPA